MRYLFHSRFPYNFSFHRLHHLHIILIILIYLYYFFSLFLRPSYQIMYHSICIHPKVLISCWMGTEPCRIPDNFRREWWEWWWLKYVFSFGFTWNNINKTYQQCQYHIFKNLKIKMKNFIIFCQYINHIIVENSFKKSSCDWTSIVPLLASLTVLIAYSKGIPLKIRVEAANKPVLPNPAWQCAITTFSFSFISILTNLTISKKSTGLDGIPRSTIGKCNVLMPSD